MSGREGEKRGKLILISEFYYSETRRGFEIHPCFFELSGSDCRFYGGDFTKAMASKGDGVLIAGVCRRSRKSRHCGLLG